MGTLRFAHPTSSSVGTISLFDIKNPVRGGSNMRSEMLIQMLCESFSNLPALRVKVNSPIKVHGMGREELRKSLIQEDALNNSIHKAGVYVFANEIEVLRIGEGDPDYNKIGTGKMGSRAFKRLEEDWVDEASIIYLVPILPAAFSRLGEQMAFALHYQVERRLPKYNSVWR
jgi:hypothetical protein